MVELAKDEYRPSKPKEYRRSIDRRLSEVEAARAVLDAIDADWLYEMQRRREQSAVPDGHSGDRSPAKEFGRSTAVEHSADCPTAESPHPECECRPVPMTGVESTAMRLPAGCAQPLYAKREGIPGRFCTRCGLSDRDHVPDPIGSLLEEIFDLVDRATQALRTLDKKAAIVLHAADAYQGRHSKVGDCDACGATVTGIGTDRLKSGYGPCCYEAWRWWSKKRRENRKDVSHFAFQQQRRIELERKAEEERQKAERAEKSA